MERVFGDRGFGLSCFRPGDERLFELTSRDIAVLMGAMEPPASPGGPSRNAATPARSRRMRLADGHGIHTEVASRPAQAGRLAVRSRQSSQGVYGVAPLCRTHKRDPSDDGI